MLKLEQLRHAIKASLQRSLVDDRHDLSSMQHNMPVEGRGGGLKEGRAQHMPGQGRARQRHQVSKHRVVLI